MTPGPVRSHRVAFAALTDADEEFHTDLPFHPTDQFAAAPLVVAVDRGTGLLAATFRALPCSGAGSPTAPQVEMALPGQFPLESARQNSSFPEGTLVVEVDGEEELGKLITLIKVTKGPIYSRLLAATGAVGGGTVSLGPPVTDPVRRPPFPECVREALRHLAVLYAGDPARVAAELEDRLQRAEAPERDLAGLELVAQAVGYFCGLAAVPGETPADVAAVACALVNRSGADARDAAAGTVTQQRAIAIAGWLHSPGSAQWRYVRAAARRCAG